MKPINIFGRKISVVAVLMIALLVGTASAALITSYGSVSGIFTVQETISVDGGSFTADMASGTASFNIGNEGDATSVNIIVGLVLDDGLEISPVINDDGITLTLVTDSGTPPGTVYLSDIDDPDETGEYNAIEVSVPGATTESGSVSVTITFGADSGVEPGDYTINVDVVPV